MSITQIIASISEEVKRGTAMSMSKDIYVYGIEVVYFDGRRELFDAKSYNIEWGSDYGEKSLRITLTSGYEVFFSSDSYKSFYVYTTEEAWKKRKEVHDIVKSTSSKKGIKKVIFNPPATIVMWNDGSKTICKTDLHDTFNPEIGLAMCIAKRYFGSRSQFLKEVKNAEKYD